MRYRTEHLFGSGEIDKMPFCRLFPFQLTHLFRSLRHDHLPHLFWCGSFHQRCGNLSDIVIVDVSGSEPDPNERERDMLPGSRQCRNIEIGIRNDNHAKSPPHFLLLTSHFGSTSGSAIITLKNVSLQESLLVFVKREGEVLLATTYFVPYCEFPTPMEDDADLQTSFPFSRFVKGQQSFQINFAVGGAEANGKVTLLSNENELCEWKGVKVTQNKSTICTDLVKNITSNLRIFSATFPTRSDLDHEIFRWSTRSMDLAVTVDYTQSGTSPEVAECNRKYNSNAISYSILRYHRRFRVSCANFAFRVLEPTRNAGFIVGTDDFVEVVTAWTKEVKQTTTPSSDWLSLLHYLLSLPNFTLSALLNKVQLCA
ncbi:unnamed protein product [Hydatigera taeniaeformis]|uniref:DUF5727 domain-containing protein n=1 Tax=Hydatigena taeniaeformis TaxID=6205 RepID=A0A0R3X885_HYDTA|nr:unnamed protein product [Hydatigera taeniaeformis]